MGASVLENSKILFSAAPFSVSLLLLCTLAGKIDSLSRDGGILVYWSESEQ